jgi:hypothetical protein
MLIKTHWKPGSEPKGAHRIDRLAHIVARGQDEVIAGHDEALAAKRNTRYVGEIERTADGVVDLKAEIEKRPDALWLRAKAIVADEENDNGDYFAREEVVKSYGTFEGCPVFTNHENDKVERAKGKVVLAEWDEKDNSVYVTFFVDREAHPELCRAVEEGYVTDVSMGTQVDYSTCSVCEKKAFTADDYCEHVKTMKGRTVDGKRVYEHNYGLKFIELSIVTDGACKDCTIREVLDPEDFLLRAAEMSKAAAGSADRIFATGAISREAGQQEVEKLNDAMELIIDVSKVMLDQRQYIDLEFLNNVTEVLASLQHVTDELVDQGYGAVGEQDQTAAGQMEVPPMPEGQEGLAPEGPQPVMEQAGPTGIGSITEPATAAGGATWSKFSQHVKELEGLVEKISSEGDLAHGDRNVDKNAREGTVRKLAGIWENPSVRQFSTEISDGDFKVVVGKDEVIGLRDGTKIASLTVADLDEDIRAGIAEDPKAMGGHILDALRTKYRDHVVVAERAPSDTPKQQQQTFEAQLEDQRTPLHPREDDVRENITESQLSEKRWGENYQQHHRDANDEGRWESIIEKQLNKDRNVAEQFERQDDERRDIQEGQLDDKGIKGNTNPRGEHADGVTGQTQEITQKQLMEHRGGDIPAPEEITDAQLSGQTEPWGRRIANKEHAKLALGAACKAMARTAIATGATPDEVTGIAGLLVSSPSNCVEVAQAIDKSAGRGGDDRERMFRRAGFHGSKIDSSPADVERFLLGSMADAGFSGEVGATVLSSLVREDGLNSRITRAMKEEKEDDVKVVEASVHDLLREAMTDDAEESIRVELPISEIKADPADKEEFAKAAFAAAAKAAAGNGVKVTRNVDVEADGDQVRVSVAGRHMSDDEKQAARKALTKADLKARREARRVNAQFGGEGGGMPAAPGGDPMGGLGTTAPGAPAGAPMPPGAAPVSALTGAPEGEMPGDEDAEAEALPPGSICPVCGTDDVTLEDGEGECDACGAKFGISVKMEVTRWPDTIIETEPGEEGEEDLEEEPGLGDMEGGPGMEMPPAPDLGVAASFKLTPEMVKKAGKKPIGSHCPSCGSGNVKLAVRKGTSRGSCPDCGGKHRVDTFVDADDKKTLWARVEWTDLGVKRASTAIARKIATSIRKGRKLANALKFTGKTAAFEEGDLKTKAEIIADLKSKELLD